jgi:aarF domain-containing kinase
MSLVQMGATEADVDTAKFADDLRQIFEGIDNLEPEVILTETADGNNVAAAVAVDQQEVSRLVIDIVRVGDRNGVKFPREFGLLLKQVLYFDRYVRLLAPDMEVVSDERVAFMDSAATLSPNAAGRTIDIDSFGNGGNGGPRFA